MFNFDLAFNQWLWHDYLPALERYGFYEHAAALMAQHAIEERERHVRR